MSSGALSSLGIGSSVLTYEVIEKLRAADESSIITPIDNRLEKNTAQQNDLKLITNYTNILKNAASALGSDLLYLGRDTQTSGTSASLVASGGVSVQSIALDVESLASKDIHQTKGFSSQSDAIFTDSSIDTITLEIDGKSYDISVHAGMTLSEFSDAINNNTDGKIEARVMNVGGANPYSLIIQSAETGESQAITMSAKSSVDIDNTDALFTSSSGNIITSQNFSSSDESVFGTGNSGTTSFTVGDKTYDINVKNGMSLQEYADEINSVTEGELIAEVIETDNGDGTFSYSLGVTSKDGEDIEVSSKITSKDGTQALEETLGMKNITEASDAKFTYNGIAIQRSTNQIDDLVTGLSFTLLDEGKTTFNITQDTSALVAQVNNFVNAYNDLMQNVKASTSFDSETNTAGTLQGVSQVNNIKFMLNRMITSIDSEGRSLSQFGIDFNEDGNLIVDENVLKQALDADPKGLENFFKGETTINETKFNSNGTVSAGALNVTSEQFTINGTSITFSTSESLTAEENLQAMLDAINSQVGSQGIVASINNAGKLSLVHKNGGDIEIAGDVDVLASLGLKQTSVYGSYEQSEGIFAQLNNTIDTLINKTSGTLTLLNESYTSASTRMTTEKARSIERLDLKYQTMVNQFAAYDAIIANLNNQFTVLQSMIEAQYADS